MAHQQSQGGLSPGSWSPLLPQVEVYVIECQRSMDPNLIITIVPVNAIVSFIKYNTIQWNKNPNRIKMLFL